MPPGRFPAPTALIALEDALYAAARVAIGDAQLQTGPLVDAIRDRSARYTSDRDRLARPASPRGDLAARAVFFTVTDAPKIALPLAELASRGALPAARPLRVVDLGAGCGAMSLGLVAALPPDTALSITAIDRDRDAIAIAASAMRSVAPHVAFATRADDATSERLPACDLVVMGTLLNELPSDAMRLSLVERALAAISEDGAVILLEPALRDTTRALHALRDSAIARGAHVFAPCTRQSAPCPALADPTEWCHEHVPLGTAPTLPPRTAELARLTHLRDDGLKFSYLVLRRHALSLSEDPAAWRVVGVPWQQKGKLEVRGCGTPGLVTLRLLKRHRALANRALEDATRGHVLRVAAPVEDGRVEVTSDTTVAVVFPPPD